MKQHRPLVVKALLKNRERRKYQGILDKIVAHWCNEAFRQMMFGQTVWRSKTAAPFEARESIRIPLQYEKL